MSILAFSRQIISILIACTTIGYSYAQSDHQVIGWSYGAEHLKDNVYKITIKASMLDPEWHFWTLNPGNDILIPTTIHFDDMAGVDLSAPLIVEGKEVEVEDELFGKVSYYEGETFFNKIIIAEKGTEIKGSIRFQACNKSVCLSPKEIPFSIILK